MNDAINLFDFNFSLDGIQRINLKDQIFMYSNESESLDSVLQAIHRYFNEPNCYTIILKTVLKRLKILAKDFTI